MNNMKDYFVIKTGMTCKRDDYKKVRFDEIGAFIGSNRNSLEIYKKNEPVRLFMDIEKEYEIYEKSLVDIEVSKIIRLLGNEWFLLNGTGVRGNKYKLSIHAIHKEIGFKNGDMLSQWMIDNDPGGLKKNGMVDMGVYGKNESSLRCIGCIMPLKGKMDPFMSVGLDKDGIIIDIIDANILDYMLTYPAKKILDIEVKGDNSKLKNKEKDINIVEEVNLDELEEICNLIDSKYWTDRDSWIRICWGLKNIGVDKRIEDIFFEGSKKAKGSYNIRSCIAEWDNANPDGKIGIGTLYKYAKESNGDGFMEIKKKYMVSNTDDNRLMFLDNKNEFYYNVQMIKKWNQHRCENIGDFLNDLTKVVGRYAADGSTYYVIKYNERYSTTNEVGDLKGYGCYIVNGKRKKNGEDGYDYVSWYNMYNRMGSINPNCIQYTGAIYDEDPNRIVDTNYINMWPGFKAKKVDNPNYNLIDPILEHILWIIVNGKKHAYEYILNWLAHIIQRPHIPTMVCLMLVGPKRCGKGTFVWFLINYIFGKAIAGETTKWDDIAGDFNKFIGGKKFMNLNEVSCVNKGFWNHNMQEKLKSVITDRVQRKTKKGRDTENDDCARNLMMTSNNSFLLKMDSDSVRYAAFRCSGKYANNRQYFESLRDCMMKYGDIFYTYLLERDITNIDLSNDLIKTELLMEMRINAAPEALGFIKFIMMRYKSGTYISGEELWNIFISEFIYSIPDEKTIQRIRYNIKSQRKLISFLNDYMKDMTTRKNNIRGYLLNTAKLNKNLKDMYGDDIWDNFEIGNTSGKIFL